MPAPKLRPIVAFLRAGRVAGGPRWWTPGTDGHMIVAWIAYPPHAAYPRPEAANDPQYKIWIAGCPRRIGRPAAAPGLHQAANWPDSSRAGGYVSDGQDGGSRRQTRRPRRRTSATRIGTGTCTASSIRHSAMTTRRHTRGFPNVLTELTLLRDALASPSTTNIKSYDLVWLIRGDVHQPLSCRAYSGTTTRTATTAATSS